MKRRTLLAMARARKHWTLAIAAEHLQVDINTLSRWERGLTRPRAYNKQQLCEIYGATAVALGLEDELFVEDAHDVLTNLPEQAREEASQDPFTDLLRDLTLSLFTVVWNWPRHDTRYHELQWLIMQETEEYAAMNPPGNDLMSRREALRRLALMPIKLFGLTAAGAVLNHPIEEILTQCAGGITACWYLRKGKELRLASGIVAAYVPTLKVIVRSTATSVAQRKAAAGLLVQCLLLQATLTRHIEGSNEAIRYAQQAEQYSEIASNTLYQVLALRTLASVHYYANHWEQALSTAEKAQYLLEQTQNMSIPNLVHSYIYAGLATYQAHNEQKQKALTSLRMAHATFFARSSAEHVPIWVDHSMSNLVLNDGMTHLHLNMSKEAFDSFGQVFNDPTRSEVIGVEALLNQVLTEVKREDQQQDMERCIDLWTQGIEGARSLQSEQRFSEAHLAYTAMRAAWPGEKRIKDLREYMVHW